LRAELEGVVSKTEVKQAVLVFCPVNDIQKDDKTSTYSIGNTWLLAW
jgi:hypothetical protein